MSAMRALLLGEGPECLPLSAGNHGSTLTETLDAPLAWRLVSWFLPGLGFHFALHLIIHTAYLWRHTRVRARCHNFIISILLGFHTHWFEMHWVFNPIDVACFQSTSYWGHMKVAFVGSLPVDPTMG